MNVNESEDETDEWMNVEIDASGGSGQAVAVILERVAEVAEDAPNWATYDIELSIDETDTRE